jgi:hypothetical protein
LIGAKAFPEDDGKLVLLFDAAPDLERENNRVRRCNERVLVDGLAHIADMHTRRDCQAVVDNWALRSAIVNVD